MVKSIGVVPEAGSAAFASLTRMLMELIGVKVGSAEPPTAGSSVRTLEKFEPETVPWFETFGPPEYGLSMTTWKVIVTESPGASVPMLTETVPPAPCGFGTIRVTGVVERVGDVLVAGVLAEAACDEGVKVRGMTNGATVLKAGRAGETNGRVVMPEVWAAAGCSLGATLPEAGGPSEAMSPMPPGAAGGEQVSSMAAGRVGTVLTSVIVPELLVVAPGLLSMRTCDAVL